jgi:virulence-associated protein VapD
VGLPAQRKELMTITPIYPRRTKENIVPTQARNLYELIKKGLESGRFKVVNGTIVLNEEVEKEGK